MAAEIIPSQPHKQTVRRLIVCVSRYLATGGLSGHNEGLKSTLDALRADGVQIVYLWLDGPAFYAPWQRIPYRAVQVDHLVLGQGFRIGERVFSTSLRTWGAGLLLVAANRWLRYLPRLADGVMRRTANFAEGILARTRVSAANVSGPSERETAMFQQLLRTVQPDAVLINYAYLGELATTARAAGFTSCIFTHDVAHQLHATMVARGLMAEGLAVETEAELLRKADALMAVQEEEAQVLRQLAPRATVFTVPTPLTVIPPRRNGNPDVMLCVGSGTGPNADGIKWFLQDVWPLVKANLPAARLRICGSVCSLLQNVPAGVELAGVVPDLAGEYETASLVIAPLLAGSGLKIKIVEAFAHGRPVVATSIGFQGLSATENVCALRADQPVDFANACIRVQSDEALRQRMSLEALNYARTHHSPEACIKPFMAWLESIIVREMN